MHFIRRFFLTDMVALAFAALFCFCIAASVWMVAGSSKSLESAMAKSNAYAELIPDALQQHKSETIGGVPLSDPAIRAAITQAFPAKTVQASAISVLDGTYAWLQGKTAQPNFNVDLTAERDQAVSAIAAYAATRYSALPTCNVQTIEALAAQPVGNPYNLACQFPELSSTQVSAQVRQTLLASSNGFLKTPVINSSTIKDKNGKPLAASTTTPPRIYKNARLAVLLLAVLGFAGLAGTILLSQERWHGARIAARIALGIGFASALIGTLLSLILNATATKVVHSAQHSSSPLNTVVTHVIQRLAGSVFAHMAVIGLVLMALGGLGLLLVHKYAHTDKTEKHTPPAEPTPANADQSEPLASDPKEQAEKPEKPKDTPENPAGQPKTTTRKP